MAVTFSGAFDVRPFSIQLVLSAGTQNIAANTTVVHWYLRIYKNGNSTPFNNNTSPWYVDVDGGIFTGNSTYNLSNVAIGSYIQIASGTKTVTHNADGSKAIAASAWFNDSAGQLDYAYCQGAMTLPTIPRASNATFSASSVDAGDPITINTNRASTSFTHQLNYTFGSASGVIATGVGASYTWTPPLSLLNQIPSATQGSLTVTTRTYSGATLIGSTSKAFTLKAPTEIVPTFGTVTHSEAVPIVATEVGAYVQGVSKLALAITSAAGAYGSTISSYKIEVAGQTINAVSGTTPSPLGVSGSMNIVGTVTDSRGRSTSQSIPISVLAYLPPTITSMVARRALSDGTPNEEGSYIRFDINAAVQSLIGAGGTAGYGLGGYGLGPYGTGSTGAGVEKNKLTYKLYTRLRGDTTWVLKDTTLVGGITFNGYEAVGTYPITEAYDVRVEVIDLFSTSAIQALITTSAIFMHWDESEGVGVGKYREFGTLDVAGDIYARGGIVSPAGIVQQFAGSTAPQGWLLCDGSSFDPVVYADLYAAIGTTYGGTSGAPLLPNLKGRIPVGRDSADTTFDTIGETGGEKAHALTVPELAEHYHRFDYNSGTKLSSIPLTSTDFPGGGNVSFTQGTPYSPNRPVQLETTGESAPHNNLQPFIVMNYIIRT